MKIALTIAGSDSGGGAGLQADLKTFQAFGVHGTSVVVAVTAQNTIGVAAAEPIPQHLVLAQIEALAEDLAPDAVKSGMLATPEMVRDVAAALRQHGWDRRYVLDPVMVATSGDRLLSPDAEAVLRDALLPLAALVTPNLLEAELLTGRRVRSPEEMVAAGRALVQAGARAALVKGGHLEGAEVVDVLVTPDGTTTFRGPRLATRATHGTGCTLSAAITACLARGVPLEPAVAAGRDYLVRAMAAAPGLGRGHGPLDHSVAATIPSISKPSRSPT